MQQSCLDLYPIGSIAYRITAPKSIATLFQRLLRYGHIYPFLLSILWHRYIWLFSCFYLQKRIDFLQLMLDAHTEARNDYQEFHDVHGATERKGANLPYLTVCANNRSYEFNYIVFSRAVCSLSGNIFRVEISCGPCADDVQTTCRRNESETSGEISLGDDICHPHVIHTSSTHRPYIVRMTRDNSSA